MKPYSLAREEGDTIWMFDALDTIKADAGQTDGRFSVVEFLDFEGSSVPLHVNDRWDRGFYVLDGEYTFVIGDDPVPGSPGTWEFVPRNTPHAWRCDSAEGRLLDLTVPGGFEDFYGRRERAWRIGHSFRTGENRTSKLSQRPPRGMASPLSDLRLVCRDGPPAMSEENVELGFW